MSRASCRFFALSLVACFTATEAGACRTYMSERSVFFDEVPPGVAVPAIAKVFVMAVTAGPDQYTEAGIAYVEKAIKGEFDTVWPIRIVSMPTSCGPYLRAGDRGIVMGELRRGAYGMLELRPITESMAERNKRKSEKQGEKS